MWCLVCCLTRRRGFWAGYPGMYLFPFPSDSVGATPHAGDMPIALIVAWARRLILVLASKCPPSLCFLQMGQHCVHTPPHFASSEPFPGGAAPHACSSTPLSLHYLCTFSAWGNLYLGSSGFCLLWTLSRQGASCVHAALWVQASASCYTSWISLQLEEPLVCTLLSSPILLDLVPGVVAGDVL